MAKNKHNGVADVREQVEALAQTIIDQAAHRAVFGASRARDAASTAKSKVSNAGKSGEEAIPTLRDVALQAASAAIELWQTTRERAEGVVESAEQAISEPAHEVVDLVERRARSAANQVADRAEDVSSRARQAASQVVDRAEDVSDRARSAAATVAGRADDAREGARNAAASAVHRADDVKEGAMHAAANVAHLADDVSVRAKEATRNAAETTVATSKDTGAALLWTAAAAGIVFYALLDKGRRDQVLKFVDEAFVQAREIIRDFQGYDEEFK
jgi:hypothetical protein